ncbi:hypothetical protein GUITHDRAFT_77443 [Guillardia theta CCMP2712]|uniref:Protein kinase domain-containing protein n=1 Tax=Guillardia theta (strain CCMP2712) TaxID=905079 RepID=L1IPB2_GUITC|nr:hypothetical protein GUITHDRAFT_77443 [Guillardia theta CCMP2712]EKX38103.1 hypothetical protein GUITHDRAFT_77443 [Guillardia theta CCMP2712]|eukprot:XP_005825083.1 hypothetical protein GUITHDRAFT_77443 [Guillardia theta CCMP2712]
MRKLEAPDVDKTYIVKDKERQGAVDEEGLPIVYDKELIEAYWRKQDGALQKRWREFLSVSVPFLTKMITMLVRGGVDELKKNEVDLAREARQNLEKLGPTYIKAGQMMSVRPDVLPQPVLDELAYLQDSVKPFDTKVAVEMIEQELKAPLGKYFSEISEKPVAAASLAQVYKAKLVTGETVAVKVQRPDVLSVVSKDLYVLRRAAEVYQGLMDRFAPQQRTNYLDFMNECANQKKLKGLLEEQMVEGMYVPEVYEELCTRRLLVTEWVDGVKLSECSPEEIREVIGIGQESFLTQLLQVGFFHSDPHPGNIIRMSDESKGKIALIDFGLVACLQQEDMDQIVNAIIHLANKDYPALVDDFISLGILPPDCDRPKVIPLMDKALSPYRMYGMDGSSGAAIGGFQAMTQDALTVLNDIPFTIPPYFALIARAVVTLEGVALIGDPSYGLVMEAYPFVARKLLREDRPEVQRALQEVLYAGGGLKTSRLSVLLNGALGVVARTQGGAFIDFDSIPEEGVPLEEAIKYLLSDKARSLRNILADEVENAADVLLRQSLRKGFSAFLNNLPRPPFISSFLPSPETVPTMFLLPTASGTPQPVLRPPQELLEVVAPKLTREEELYAISLVDLIKSALGEDAATLVAGDALVDPRAASRLLLSVVSTGKLPGWSSLPAPLADALKQLLTVLNGGSVRREEEESQESSAGGWQTNLQEVLGTLEKLEEKERQELNDVVQGTGSRLWQRMLNRLETLSS